MEVTYYLKRPKSKTDTAIWARISYNGRQLKYYLPEKIDPKNWNKKTHQAIEPKKKDEDPVNANAVFEFNTRLRNFKNDIQNAYRKYVNDNNGVDPSTDELKSILDKVVKKVDTRNDETFFGYIQTIIDKSANGTRLYKKRPVSPGTIKVYNTAKKHLEEFQRIYRKKIDFNSIDLNFYESYTRYLTKGANLSANTIGKQIRTIKFFLNSATDKGINKNLAFKSRDFANIQEESDSIYLTTNELKELKELDLSNSESLERVRNLFLISCYTGLRFGDLSALSSDNIQNGMFKLRQIKTGDAVEIPIHSDVKSIIKKYKGQFPKSISNQKTNEALKEVGKKAKSLNSVVLKQITKGGETHIIKCEKWKLLSSHTGRRTFASNEYLAGTPILTIMACTGHKSEASFRKYIKLSPNEHAQHLKKLWEQRENNSKKKLK